MPAAHVRCIDSLVPGNYTIDSVYDDRATRAVFLEGPFQQIASTLCPEVRVLFHRGASRRLG